jgi:predicted metalloendopeptidase
LEIALLTKSTKDPDINPERWQICIQHVNSGLGWILSRFFVEKAYSENALQTGNRIIKDIENVFIENLKEVKWMERKVIDLAVRKVRNLRTKLGYPTMVRAHQSVSSPIESHLHGMNFEVIMLSIP